MAGRYDPEKAEYNPKNNSERKLLEKRIPNYSPELWADMVQECRSITEQIGRFSFKTKLEDRNSSTQIRPWIIKDGYGEPAYFTIKFSMPVIHYVPAAFRHLHFQFNFTLHGSVEYTPCYFMNLNHVALSKQQQARNFLPAYGEIGDGLYSKFMFEGGKSMKLSSSNVLLLGATKENVQVSEQDSIDKCFEYCYWCLPTPKKMKDVSCIHNLLYHKSNSIVRGGVLQLRKTLLKILKIRGKFRLQILPTSKNIKCSSADVALLVDDGNAIFSEKCTLFLTGDIVDSSKEGDILNALIVTQNITHPKYTLVVGSVGRPIVPGDVKPLLSVVMWKALQYLEEDSSITQVGSINKLTSDVLQIIQKNASEFDIFYPIFAWEHNVKKKAEKTIAELFPLYVLENGDVHQLSPTVLSFLLTHAPEILRNKEAISTIIGIFSLMKTNAKSWGEKPRSKLQLSVDESNHTSSFSTNTLLQNLPRLVNRMVYSRIFSQHYTYWS